MEPDPLTAAMAEALAKHGHGEPVANAPRPNPVQVEIDKLENSPAYRAGDPATLHRLKRLYEELFPAPERPPADMPSVHDTRALLGITGPQGLPAQYAEQWDVEAEADFNLYMHQEGIPGPVVQAIIDRYVREGVLGGRFVTGWTAEDESHWRAFLTEQGLKPEQISRLITWARSGGREA